MKKFITVILSLSIFTIIFAIPNYSYAAETWTFDSSTNTLYVYEDVVVSKDSNDEYIAPWNTYKDAIKIVVLENTVEKIEYAFFDYTLDKIIIKNKDINIQYGLIGTTVNIIDFTEDVSSKISKSYTEDLFNVPAATENGFSTFVTSKFNRWNGPRPFVTTNLGTNTYSEDEITKRGNSHWYIWGDNSAVMFPNQEQNVANALTFSFFETNTNEVGSPMSSGYGPDPLVVYGLEASLPETEYTAGTTINPDDLMLNVLGIGAQESEYDNDVSYWNYNLKNWVWYQNPDNIPENTYDAVTTLDNAEGYFKYKNIYINDSDYYILRDSYYYYKQPYYSGECFVGKIVNGKVYYTYNGVDWIETEYTDEYEAAANMTDLKYSNDKGEVYSIKVLEDKYYDFEEVFCKEYLYIEDGKIYSADVIYEDVEVDISTVDFNEYIQAGNIYNRKEGSYTYGDSSYIYRMWGSDESVFLGKEVDGKIYYCYNGIDWIETSYTDIVDASDNEYLECYANDKGEIYPIHVINENNYLKENGNYFEKYLYENNGTWYEAYYYKEREVSVDEYLSTVNVGFCEYDADTGRYYDYETAVGEHSGDTFGKVINGTFCIYENDNWVDTGYATCDEYNSNGWWVIDCTNYYEYNGTYYQNYYILDNNTWYKVDESGTREVVQLVYTNVNYLPLNYSQLTSASPLVVNEGENIYNFEYYGLKASVVVNGVANIVTPTPGPTPTPTPAPDSTLRPTPTITPLPTPLPETEIEVEDEPIIEETTDDTITDDPSEEKVQDTEEEAIVVIGEPENKDELIVRGEKVPVAIPYLLAFFVTFIALLLLLLLFWKKKVPFTYILNKETKEMTITGYTGKDERVIIKNSYRIFINKYSVVEIAANAFNGLDDAGKETFNVHLTYIEVPNSVIKIGSKAFANCRNLDKVTILNKNCNIAEDAFDK